MHDLLDCSISDFYPSLLRFLSSGPSSPSRSWFDSAVGFSSECTLLAMLLRRVPGAEASMPLNENFGPGSCHPASPLLLAYDGGPESGGVVCREPSLDVARGSSYCAKVSLICWPSLLPWRKGDVGHCAAFCPTVVKGEPPCGGGGGGIA